MSSNSQPVFSMHTRYQLKSNLLPSSNTYGNMAYQTASPANCRTLQALPPDHKASLVGFATPWGARSSASCVGSISVVKESEAVEQDAWQSWTPHQLHRSWTTLYQLLPNCSRNKCPSQSPRHSQPATKKSLMVPPCTPECSSFQSSELAGPSLSMPAARGRLNKSPDTASPNPKLGSRENSLTLSTTGLLPPCCVSLGNLPLRVVRHETFRAHFSQQLLEQPERSAHREGPSLSLGKLFGFRHRYDVCCWFSSRLKCQDKRYAQVWQWEWSTSWDAFVTRKEKKGKQHACIETCEVCIEHDMAYFHELEQCL